MLCLADADPQNIRTLGKQTYNPSHPRTSAYHPTMVHAYAAGRLFIRGADGMCSYDLRK